MGGNPGDKAGNITDVIYPDGSKETTEYDILGRTIKVIPRTGLTTEYTYDVLGNVTSVRQGDQFTQYEYDLLGRLTKTITADGSETAYEYDALGNLITSTDPLGNSTAFAYTPESLLEKVTYANGSQQSLTYDLAGNITSETDAEGYTKRYHYDAVNRLVGVTDELGHKTSYTYDPTDNIAQVKDALGHITGYTYDANGNLTSETDALGNTVIYQYTPEGWLEKVIKADGKEITFEYDRTGNLLTQHAGDEYTISSGYNELGQVTRVSSEAGTIEYQYDDRGYLISVKNVNGQTVSYTYDQYGNKESMTYPDGWMVWYTYDAMNRMVSVKDLDGEITCYAYDVAGRRIKTENSTLTTAYEYDIVGNLIRQETNGISSITLSYSHNKNGYITGEVREENGETTESQYGYDALGQLVSFKQSTGYGEQYTYDAAGNMTKKVISPEQTAGQKKNHPVTVKMKYNQGNQLMEMAVGKDKISYSYDPNGSMVQKVMNSQKYGTLTDEYTYDVLDQFTGYYGYDGYTQILTYDANGMRLSKKEKGNTNRSTLEELLRGNIEGLPEIVEPGTVEECYEWATTEYLYDIVQEYYQVLQEITTKGSETSTSNYIYGLERIAGYTTDTKTAYIDDGRGSVAQTVTTLIAENGLSPRNDLAQETGIQSFRYTPFGEQQNTKASGFVYNAEALDAATGMLNLRARQYEPILGSFNQKDMVSGQIKDPLTLNRYLYCANRSTMCIDPSGNSILDSIGNWWDKTKQTVVGKAIDNLIVKPITSVVKKITNAIKPLIDIVSDTVNKAAQEYKKAQQEIAKIDTSRPTFEIEAQLIWRRACAKFIGDTEAENEVNRQLNEIRGLLTSKEQEQGITIAKVANQYYKDYTTLVDRVLMDAVPEFREHTVGNGQDTNLYKMISSWEDYLWFANQVNHGAKYDIKEPDPWKQVFGTDISMPSITEGFVYRGKVITREDLGNIMYGYLGTATGAGPVTLFVGGGVANQIDFSTASIDEIIDALSNALDPHIMAIWKTIIYLYNWGLNIIIKITETENDVWKKNNLHYSINCKHYWVLEFDY